jgi:thiamine-phosphate pyrophosphorylase
MFPSSSVDRCEIVPLEMIREAKRSLSIPVFASGGITFENIDQVLEAGADGIAVVSAILRAASPREAAQQFKQKIEAYRNKSQQVA